MIRAIGTLILPLAVLIACSPAPTPLPTSTATIESAAEAYSAFVASWTDEHADEVNAAAAAADTDASQVDEYATILADAYQAFGDGLRAIEFPESVQTEVDRELDTTGVLVGLARQLAATPSDASVKTELHQALARVAQSSASVEAALGLSN